MHFPRPSLCLDRPAYLDRLYQPHCERLLLGMNSPSVRSSKSNSISSIGSDRHSHSSSTSSTSSYHHGRPQWPAALPAPPSPHYSTASSSFDDKVSVKSFRLRLTPRFRRFFHKRSSSEVQETTEPTPSTALLATHDYDLPYRTSMQSSRSPRSTPSLSRLRRPTTSHGSSHAIRPEPKIEYLKPCYYSLARNCHGTVFAGGDGEACEACVAAGFLGAP